MLLAFCWKANICESMFNSAEIMFKNFQIIALT